MRVLLVGPDQEDNLSVRYLASSLTSCGYDVELAVFNSAADANEIVRKANRFQFVGLSMTFQARAREFLELARKIKKSTSALVVAGGHWASCAAEEILEHHKSIDAIVVHEGEATLVQLVNAAANRNRWIDIKGIVFREGEEIRRTAPRPILKDLDQLPFPDRRGKPHLFAGVPTAYMLGSRGCLANCDYCCIATLHDLAPGKSFRRRSPKKIAEEMSNLYYERGVRQFIFHDDNFLVPSTAANHRRLDALESAWVDAGCVTRNIGLVIKCRPGDVEESVFVRLKKLGLVRVFLGIESASSAGLTSIGRKQTIEQSEQALRICEQLEISTQYTIMCFHPDATVETVSADIEFMRRYLEHPLNFCRTEIYSGTPLEKRMIEEKRAYGNYLARAYTIKDPVIELMSNLALKIFFERCWKMGGLMEKTIGLNHLGAVIARFYDDSESKELQDRINSECWAVNAQLVDLLAGLMQACVESGGESTNTKLAESVKALTHDEQQSRRAAMTQNDELWEAISDHYPKRVAQLRKRGLWPDPQQPGGALAGGSEQHVVGISEFAARPLDLGGPKPSPKPKEPKPPGEPPELDSNYTFQRPGISEFAASPLRPDHLADRGIWRPFLIIAFVIVTSIAIGLFLALR